MSLYEKECSNQYFEKYDRQFNLMRTAEQFPSGNWVVSVWKGKEIQGEYTPNEFKKIKKYFN
jgi:hypothetical protein